MDLAHELHDLVRTLDARAEQILRPQGLGYTRYVALVILSEHPGITGRVLAGGLGVSEAAASGAVRALIGAGLVRDVAGAGAGHVRRLELTQQGESTLAHCSRLLGSSVDDCARRIGLDPQDLARSVRALHDEVRPAVTPTTKESS